MLLNDLYTINRVFSKPLETQVQIDASLTIDPAHKIFQGHFPGRPVMPGVCMLQIVKEIAEHQLAKKLLLTTAASLKFLAVFDPRNNTELSAEIRFKPNLTGIELEGKLYH